jgi:ATP-dependent DNA helicase RecG
MLDFLSPLSIIPGMGPKRIAALQEGGIETIGDLLYKVPRRHIDRSTIIPLNAIHTMLDKTCTVQGTIDTVRVERGRMQRLRALISDGTGSMELLWFNGGKYLRPSLVTGRRIIATGKVTRYKAFQMAHPVIDTATAAGTAEIPVLPLYGLTAPMREAGVGQQFMRKSIRWILDNCHHYPGLLPERLETRKAFPPLAECLREIHFPSNTNQTDRFCARLRYEELYRLALTLYMSRRKFIMPGRPLSAGPLRERLEKLLPFTLTDDQRDCIARLLADSASPNRMHRLLQGDVGSGKTVVALFAALPALNEGLQAVWMTPTEVLARQTCGKLREWLTPMGFEVDLFTSSVTGSERSELRRRMTSGEARCIVGTHALLQQGVGFRGVGIFIIDEQHRFGAQQRLTLHEKDGKADMLLMSATPIPQTLAQTLYGDLDIAAIRGLPPGRMPIATHLVPDDKRDDMERFIRDRIGAGERCFYIVPRVEKEESVDDAPPVLHDLETTFASLTKGVFQPVPAAFIHGKLDSASKEQALDGFTRGTFALLVATSVVEVGIDVPDATIIVIENSERFGLAQLHQLRGRVGRGTKKSYCFLLSAETADENTRKRLSGFCREHDGFALAEMDLAQRGPGEVTGFRQSGWDDLLFADILRDANLFAEIRSEIEKILTTHNGN